MSAWRWLGSVAAMALLAYPAWAGWGVSVGFGYRPYGCYRPYWGYYRPVFPVVVGIGAPAVYPPPVVVQPAPVVYTTPPPVAVPPPPPPPAAPQPVAAASLPPAPVPVAAPTPAPASASPGEINRCLDRLANPDEKTRAEAVVQLGRLHASQAVDSMTRVLTSDRSATVREAAARGLGLIGTPNALPALQQAAQADEDRDVRNSARFAVEVIRSRTP